MIKKFFCLIILLALCGVCYAQTMLLERGDWRESRCELCGKRIYHWVAESSYGIYGESYTPLPYCPGEQRQLLEYKRTLDVCPICYEKNRIWFQNAISETADKTIQAIKDTYKEERKKNEARIKQEDLQAIDKDIEKLKEKKRDIKEGKHEEESLTIRLSSGSCITDSGKDYILPPNRK